MLPCTYGCQRTISNSEVTPSLPSTVLKGGSLIHHHLCQASWPLSELLIELHEHWNHRRRLLSPALYGSEDPNSGPHAYTQVLHPEPSPPSCCLALSGRST